MHERDIFLAALEINDPAERAAYVEQACGADAALRSQVDSLLQSHAQTSQFLETPAVVNASSVDQTFMSDSAETDDAPAEPAAGEAEFRKYLQPATRPGWLGRLGHYEIEAILGRGAFGIVAKAFDEKLHRVVAIKLMNPELASTSPPRKRFLREARTAAAVTHENIVAIHAVEEEPIPYLVMEYIPGQTLQQRMDAEGPFETGDILRIGRQVAAGLAAAHAANLIHRDIKPSNILLSDGPTSRAKISDFGLARAVDDASMTSSGLIAGTPMYMAPEQARGETLDHRADLFSLGSVLYQMASGRPPFRAANTIAVLKRVCEDTPRPLDDVLPGTPGWLETIIFKLLEKDRDDRYQTAQEVADLLARCQRELEDNGKVTCVEGRLGMAATQVFQANKSISTGAKKKPFGWLVGGVIAVAAVIGIVLMNGGEKTPDSDLTNSSGNTTSASTSGMPANPTSANGWHGWPADAPPPAIAPFDAKQALAHQEAWAKYLGVPVEYTNSIGMKFRLIPPGEFLMGSSPEEIQAALNVAGEAEAYRERIQSEGPQHKVVLTQPIYIGVTEVTQSQYEQIMGTNPSHFAASGEGKDLVANLETGNHPVEMVSWNDAAEFCSKLSQQEKLKPFYFRSNETISPLAGTGYRLPTEAEWESACRAGTTTRFWSGDGDLDLIQSEWLSNNSGGRTHAAGELKANPFGLWDVHGNVWEWVQDGWDATWYGQFEEKPAIDSSHPFFAGSQRVLRGGNWYYAASHCRSSNRYAHDPTTRLSNVGFRVSLPIHAVIAALKTPVTGPASSANETLAEYYARNRRAAEKALAVAGDLSEVFVEIPQLYEWRRYEWRRFTAGQSLPDEPFVVRHWSVKNSAQVSNDDLDVLAGLRHVLNLNLMAQSGLDSGCVPKIGAVRASLKDLGIGHLKLKTSDLSELPVMPHVHMLWLSAEQVDDEWRFLRKFPALRAISLYGSPVPDLQPLGKATQLRRLLITTWGTAPDLAQIREVQAGNPQLRVLLVKDQQLSILGADPAMAAARRLLEAGIPVSGFTPDGTVRSLTPDALDQTIDLSYTVQSIPRGVILTEELRGLLTYVDLQNIQAEGRQEADALADILRDRQDVEIMNLANSDLTDEGLRSLQQLTGLRLLSLNGTKVTADGISAFHRAVPGCHLGTDAGDIQIDYMATPQPTQPRDALTR